MRRLVIGAVAIAVLVIAGVLIGGLGRPAGSTPTAEVVRADLAVTVELAGTIQPRDSRTVGFGTAGTVAEVLVDVGDRVREGQLLARLDDALATAQVDAAEAALASAEARLAADKAGPTDAQLASAYDPVRQAEAALSAAKQARTQVVESNAEVVATAQAAVDDAEARLAADEESGAGPAILAVDQLAVDLATAVLDAIKESQQGAVAQADSAVRTAEASVRAARNAYAVRAAPVPDALIAADEAAVASARASAEAARQSIALTELRSPLAGTIVELGLEVDQRVAGGGAAIGSSGGFGTALGAGTVTVADLSSLEVAASASEIDVVDLALDQPVEVTLDALPGRSLVGSVCDIAVVGRSDSGVVAFPVTICLTTTDAELRVGMSANVSIVLEAVTGVLVVPTGSIRTVDGRPTVEVVDADGRTTRVEVGIGISNLTRTEIRSGLVEGQRVALRPSGSGASGGGD